MNNNLDCLQDLIISKKKKNKYSEQLPPLFVKSIELFIQEIIEKCPSEYSSDIIPKDIENIVQNSGEYNFLNSIIEN